MTCCRGAPVTLSVGEVYPLVWHCELCTHTRHPSSPWGTRACTTGHRCCAVGSTHLGTSPCITCDVAPSVILSIPPGPACRTCDGRGGPCRRLTSYYSFSVVGSGLGARSPPMRGRSPWRCPSPCFRRRVWWCRWAVFFILPRCQSTSWFLNGLEGWGYV